MQGGGNDKRKRNLNIEFGEIKAVENTILKKEGMHSIDVPNRKKVFNN